MVFFYQVSNVPKIRPTSRLLFVAILAMCTWKEVSFLMFIPKLRTDLGFGNLIPM